MGVDLVLLCGFLGSGKTTLLVDWLRDPAAADTGVIVNEVGEIGIDGVIIANDSDSVPMTLLTNGCVCCSLRSDLVTTLSALLDARPLKRVVLECSGLSRPGPVVASLADPELARHGLRLTVLCTDDCTRDADALGQTDEAIAQYAAAQRIVLTKADQVSPQQLEARAARAAATNPLATIIADADRARAVRNAFGPAASSTDLAALAARLLTQGTRRASHPRIHVMTARALPGIGWTEFSEWLDDLAGLCGERLLRLKAVVRVADCPEPILIQSVGTTFSAPQRLVRRPDAQEAIVVITRDIDAAQIGHAAPDGPVRMIVETAQSTPLTPPRGLPCNTRS